MLYVNEIFASIQGEGAYTGTPAVFVRMQGCLCHCPWCDTKHTWKLGEPNDKTLDFALSKADAPHYATCTDEELVSFIHKHWPHIKHVVFTGGEPMLFDLKKVTEALHDLGHTTQVETSGTEPIKADDLTWITISPKFGMGRDILAESVERASEIKMVVGCEEDIKNLDALLEDVETTENIYLQPLSCSKEATELCVKTAMERGWKVSLQTHKFMNIR